MNARRAYHSTMTLYYTTVAGFESKVPQVLQWKGTNDSNGTVINEDYVSTFLKEAESLVDSYFNGRYSTPIKAPDGSVPAVISGHVYTLAKYELFKRRNLVDAAMQAQYDHAIMWLRDVARGLIGLAVYSADGVRDTSRDTFFVQGRRGNALFGGGVPT
jgi:phage gp36-like protein